MFEFKKVVHSFVAFIVAVGSLANQEIAMALYRLPRITTWSELVPCELDVVDANMDNTYWTYIAKCTLKNSDKLGSTFCRVYAMNFTSGPEPKYEQLDLQDIDILKQNSISLMCKSEGIKPYGEAFFSLSEIFEGDMISLYSNDSKLGWVEIPLYFGEDNQCNNKILNSDSHNVRTIPLSKLLVIKYNEYEEVTSVCYPGWLRLQCELNQFNKYFYANYGHKLIGSSEDVCVKSKLIRNKKKKNKKLIKKHTILETIDENPEFEENSFPWYLSLDNELLMWLSL